jgi:hypothetical protein
MKIYKRDKIILLLIAAVVMTAAAVFYFTNRNMILNNWVNINGGQPTVEFTKRTFTASAPGYKSNPEFWFFCREAENEETGTVTPQGERFYFVTVRGNWYFNDGRTQLLLTCFCDCSSAAYGYGISGGRMTLDPVGRPTVGFRTNAVTFVQQK